MLRDTVSPSTFGTTPHQFWLCPQLEEREDYKGLPRTVFPGAEIRKTFTCRDGCVSTGLDPQPGPPVVPHHCPGPRSAPHRHRGGAIAIPICVCPVTSFLPSFPSLLCTRPGCPTPAVSPHQNHRKVQSGTSFFLMFHVRDLVSLDKCSGKS